MPEKEIKLKVSEIFYSLQGEGARSGEASIFIRLSGCSAKHACAAGGVVCDTEFESGEEMSISDLKTKMAKAVYATGIQKTGHLLNERDRTKEGTSWIVWSGGEPLDNLTPEILRHFRGQGYKQALETSGIKSMTTDMANLFDHITISPKVAEHILAKHFMHLNHLRGRQDVECNVDELRYVRHSGQPGVPVPALKAKYYYLSPHSDGAEINQENLRHCIKLCLENPMWRLSVQMHKVFKIL
jgi:organic radical activating enzyme